MTEGTRRSGSSTFYNTLDVELPWVFASMVHLKEAHMVKGKMYLDRFLVFLLNKSPWSCYLENPQAQHKPKG